MKAGPSPVSVNDGYFDREFTLDLGLIHPNVQVQIDGENKLTLRIPMGGPPIKVDIPDDIVDKLGPTVVEMINADIYRKVMGQLIATTVRY